MMDLTDFGQRLLFCFIPIFVAMDPLASLPIFVSLTAGQDAASRARTSTGNAALRIW